MENIGILGLDLTLLVADGSAASFCNVELETGSIESYIFPGCRVEIHKFLCRDIEFTDTLGHNCVFRFHCTGDGVSGHTGAVVGLGRKLLEL